MSNDYAVISLVIPIAQVTPSNAIIVNQNDSVSFVCSSSSSAADVTWVNIGSNQLSGNARQVANGTLSIASAQASDTGGYTCNLNNSAGRDATNVTVFVIG